MKRQLQDSGTDSVASLNFNRLGKCEICNYHDSKYTCPKCEIKSCCIKCLNIHKKELNCDGVRDRTKFIPLKKMTKLDFMNDYYFLEECTRYVYDRKTDKMKRYTSYNKSLPSHLFQLRNAAHKRKTTLRFLLQNFSRHISNTTYYDFAQKLIYWRIEWIFVNATNLKCVDEKCNEKSTLYELLDKYLNPESEAETDTAVKKHLAIYQSRGIGNLTILLKAEGIKNGRNRFFELDCKKTLQENLAEKIIIEHPIIHVCYDVIDEEHNIIDSDEDVIAESKRYLQTLDAMNKPNNGTGVKTEEQIRQETEERRHKRRLERKKRRLANAVPPKNFLFTEDNQTDKNFDDGSSSSDETEEEP